MTPTGISAGANSRRPRRSASEHEQRAGQRRRHERQRRARQPAGDRRRHERDEGDRPGRGGAGAGEADRAISSASRERSTSTPSPRPRSSPSCSARSRALRTSVAGTSTSAITPVGRTVSQPDRVQAARQPDGGLRGAVEVAARDQHERDRRRHQAEAHADEHEAVRRHAVAVGEHVDEHAHPQRAGERAGVQQREGRAQVVMTKTATTAEP